jgi:tetratricopeptide (TPR) repeat protein
VAGRLSPYESCQDPLTEALIHESSSTTFLLQQAATVNLTTNATWREYLVRRALEFDSDHEEALYDLAIMFRMLRRYDEALKLLGDLRRRQPDNFQILADIGQCLWGLRRFAEAEEVLRRALGNLDNADTRNGLGLVLDQVGRSREAVVEYRRALDRNPNHLGALNNLGAALVGRGQPNEAIRQFERLVALAPGDSDAQTNLGVVLAMVGLYEQAERAFRQALRFDPSHEGARIRLSQIELR